jgi:hypothetical protein
MNGAWLLREEDRGREGKQFEDLAIVIFPFWSSRRFAKIYSKEHGRYGKL